MHVRWLVCAPYVVGNLEKNFKSDPTMTAGTALLPHQRFGTHFDIVYDMHNVRICVCLEYTCS